MAGVRLWLLDLDDTLLKDLEVSRALLEELGRGLGLEGLGPKVQEEAQALFREAPFYPWAQRIGHSALEALWARYTTPGLEALRAWAGWFRVEVFRRALLALGGEVGEASRLAQAFFERRRQYPLFPETSDFLQALRQRGVYIALLTNGVPDLQREKLVGAGLGEAFDLILISGEVGWGKPDPRLFRLALGAFGLTPEEAAMLGDNPERDIAGALAAGVWAVQVDRGHRPLHPGAHRVVRDLREALDLLG